MIKLSGLNKYYNRGKSNEIHVINDANLELGSRGMVAIFGRSGCGKTTLLNVIGGLDDFRSGSVEIDGRDVGCDTDALRNEYVGYIFQNYNLRADQSCFDNVADALRLCGIDDDEVIHARTMAALSNVGMEKYHARTPDTLSGGQQQRIAIARAIVKNPRIILADEPTGNLDEANTVMIMDLLKAISRDHLVLLVTHESDLVDHYCDSVIELSDGRIVGMRENKNARGFFGRDKNTIYLGELPKRELAGDCVKIDYYGEPSDAPLRLTVVNVGGKLYLKASDRSLSIVDDSSETRFEEGAFEEKEIPSHAEIDMSSLPPIHGKRFGRLFNFASSVKSGIASNVGRKRRGRRLLISCMCLFSAIMVMASALFGTVIGEVSELRLLVNQNSFYVDTSDPKTVAELRAAMLDPASGIDYTRHTYAGGAGDDVIMVLTQYFETFESSYNTTLSSNAVWLEHSLAESLPLVAGRKTDLRDEEILISSALADALLEESPLGYISEPKDLIGLVNLYGMSINGLRLRIAGVVESPERVFYVSPLAMAKNTLENTACYADRGSALGVSIGAGEAMLYIRSRLSNVAYPNPGEKILIRGHEVRVTDVIEYQSSYEKWLDARGIGKKTFEERLAEYERKLTDGLGLSTIDLEYRRLRDLYIDENFFPLLFDYYSELDAYMRECFFFAPGDYSLWLYCEKGVREAAYDVALGGDEQDAQYLYIAELYRAQNGRYPTVSEYNSFPISSHKSLYEVLSDAKNTYMEEFLSTNANVDSGIGSTHRYLVSDEDYVELARSFGESHPSALGDYFGEENTLSCRILVHSSDVEATANYLATLTGATVISPDELYEEYARDSRLVMIANLTFMLVLLALMCLCMYFIMRSSLMSRVKEIGILRAIGVSRKNLLFRFGVESLVLASVTVLPGYLFSSIVMGVWLANSALIGSLFYYPLWLALALLAVMYAVCLACGLIPIALMLRRTPSAILAKYDI